MRKSEDSTSPRQRTLVGSPAFRAAALRSEVRRAYAVMAVTALMTVFLYGRSPSQQMAPYIRCVGGVAIGVLMVLQLSVLGFARWAAPRRRSIPSWFIVTSVIIEGLIPTGMIVANIWGGSLAPYAALSAPSILIYGMLVSLTTLRLRPGLCILAGAVGALGYMSTLIYVTERMGIALPTTGLPRLAYVNSAIYILVSGAAAAWVAREIRTQTTAALDEAETRRQVEQMEHDLDAARTIQRALLPRAVPSLPGFEIAGWNRPADQTGGDYYDWHLLPDGNWIVTVADVSGHGIGPALVTAACRAYVRASSDHRGDLASLTSRINRLLADDLPDGRFVTMVSVLIDTRTQSLSLLSAGHGPIVLYAKATGAIHDILPNDLPLAIEPDQTFGPAQAVTMGMGDVLALVTDGFVEWARHDPQGNRDDFGLPRLRESLGRHAHLPAAEIIKAITADVTAFAHPAAQQDDLTMVVIRRVG